MFLTELFESIFVTDRMSAFDAIRKYPRAFTHFSDGVGIRQDQRAPHSPKLGVNPQKGHHDPYGIYFYYNSWLMDVENVSDSQFATESQHYWVCQIARTENALDLGSLTSAQAAKIAGRNGWLDTLNDCLSTGKLKTNTIEEKSLRRLGAKFWAAMDYLVNEAKSHSWAQLLRGVDAVFDPGYGIIHSNEPAQVIVFDRKLITVVEHGDNKDRSPSIFFDAMKQLQAKVGGNLQFRNKQAILDTHYGEAPVQLAVDQQGNVAISYFQDGFWATTFEREGHSTWGAENWAESLLHKYQNLKYKNPGVNGIRTRWNRENVREMFTQALGRNFGIRYVNVRDGKLQFSSGRDAFGNIYHLVSMTVDQQQNVAVDIEIGNQDHNWVDVKASYGPNTSEEAMAADIRKRAAQSIDRGAAEGIVQNPEGLYKWLWGNA